MGLTNIEAFNASVCTEVAVSCLAISVLYFVLNSAQSSGKKKKGNVTVKNYLKESLLSLLCFIIHGKVFFRKGFHPELLN